MKISYEITKDEFMSLKNGTTEGYSKLGGHYFCRLGDHQQRQLDEISKGKGTSVFLMEVTDVPINQRIFKDKPLESSHMIIQAHLVKEHCKEVKKDPVSLESMSFGGLKQYEGANDG